MKAAVLSGKDGKIAGIVTIICCHGGDNFYFALVYRE